MNNIIKIVLPICLVVLSIIFVINTNNQAQKEPDLLDEVKKVADQKYLDNAILKSIETSNFDDVQMYQDMASLINVPLSQKISEENQLSNSVLRESKSFIDGFIYGESQNSTQLVGSITSDMTVVGDIRDLGVEGKKYFDNQDYDKFVLSLAVIGIVSSTSQLVTAGSTTPIKVGTSLLKVAKKGAYLSKSFTSQLMTKLQKTVDINSIKKAYSSINIDTLKATFGQIGSINKNTSNFDTLKILKYAQNEKDLKKLSKISSKFGKNTRGVLTILGKGVLKSVKYTSIIIAKLIDEVIGILVGLLYFFTTSLPLLKKIIKKDSDDKTTTI
jgi:hypothetical protein